MTRLVVRIVVCLLLGGITTVGVAWLAVLRWDVHASGFRFARTSPTIPMWVFSVYDSSGARRTYRRLDWSISDRWRTAQIEVIDGDLHGWLPPAKTAATLARVGAQLRFIDEVGWPFPALWCEYDAKEVPNGQPVHSGRWTCPVAGGVALDVPVDETAWSGRGEKALPLRPIWPGFVTNSLLFSAGWFPIVWVFNGLRMRAIGLIRRHRGRCPKCVRPAVRF